jgi:hypothetical protein
MRTRIIAAALILAGLVWVPAGSTATDAGTAECVTPSGVQRIVFSAQKFPNVRRHFGARFGAAGPAGWSSIVEGRTRDANECCAISRRVRVSTATSTPQRLAGGAGRGWSVVATRAAGRPMCATCPALRTDHTARRSETDSNTSATAPAFATCSADSLLRGAALGPETQPHGRARTCPRHRRIGSSLVARPERNRRIADPRYVPCSDFVR